MPNPLATFTGSTAQSVKWVNLGSDTSRILALRCAGCAIPLPHSTSCTSPTLSAAHPLVAPVAGPPLTGSICFLSFTAVHACILNFQSWSGGPNRHPCA